MKYNRYKLLLMITMKILKIIKTIKKKGKYLKLSRKEQTNYKNLNKKKIEKEFVMNKPRQLGFIKNKKQR